MAHWMYERFTHSMTKKAWRTNEVAPDVPTLLVAALAGDDVAGLALADAYRDAGLDEIADAIPRRLEVNRTALAKFHPATRKAFFRACERHGICTMERP